ncbi:geranylgeranyl pyrophosphate synthetase [Lecanora helva]
MDDSSSPVVSHHSTPSLASPAISDGTLESVIAEGAQNVSEFTEFDTSTSSSQILNGAIDLKVPISIKLNGTTETCFLPVENGVNGAADTAPIDDSLSGRVLGSQKQEQIIEAPYDYLSSKPGKDIRRKLLLACNVWLQVDEPALETIIEVTSMLHTASLLIDDIEDSSKLRRGFPSAHIIYGIPQTINSANYVYFKAQQHLTMLKDWPTAMRIFNEEVMNLHRGQGMDLYWRETLTLPTEEEYLDMVSNKTGGLFRLGIRLMMMCSTQCLDLLPFTNLLGLLFQIQDDYRNLVSDRMTQTKGYCEDLTEGKFSFPIIHAIAHSPTANNDILNILKSKSEDNTVKEHAVRYMRDVTWSFAHTEEKIKGLHADATRAMKELGVANEAMAEILGKLVV